MRHLLAGFDPSSTVGWVLESIVFTANTVVLHFSGGNSITMLGAFSIAKERHTTFYRAPVANFDHMGILGGLVIASKKDEGGNLDLLLDAGYEIRAIRDAEPYESYIIQADGVEIVV